MKNVCIKTLCGAAALLLLQGQALATDYSFATVPPRDFYGSTAYVDVYGAQYNYGGQNAVDFLDPLAQTAVQSAGGIQYGLTDSGGSIVPGVTDSLFPVVWAAPSVGTAAQFTPAETLTRSDGSIGTLVIPRLSIRYPVYDGTSASVMNQGVGHFTSTSAWAGNIGLCGHNRGARYNIGSIRNLRAGDTIRYETSLGTRTYGVSSVEIIQWTDWSPLNPSGDNQITIITCLAGQPEKRVCVQAVEVCS